LPKYEWEAAAWDWKGRVYRLTGEFSEPEWVAHESQAYKQAEDQAYKKDLNGETVEVYRISQISGDTKGLRAILHEDY
jgi:hypothetical protein